MSEQELSAVETELYDRQIRLWGIESQEKLRAANVLLIGIRGLGSEIAKNILLSGINSLTILENGIVTEEELCKNFLLDRDSVEKNIAEAVLLKAQALNPLVKLEADCDLLSSKRPDFYEKFTIVVATRLKTDEILTISTICRKAKVQFICGDVFGMFGYSIADFQEHSYFEDRVKYEKSKKRNHDGKYTQPFEKSTVKEHSVIKYPDLHEVLPSKDKKKIRQPSEKSIKRRNELYYLMRVLLEFRDRKNRHPLFAEKSVDNKELIEIRDKILQPYPAFLEKVPDDMFDVVYGEVPPICAVLGGVIAQEVIKAVSHKEVPINNVFLLNPYTYSGKEETICN